MTFHALRGIVVLGTAALVAGCSSTPAGPSEPTLLEFVAGQTQQGTVGTALATKVVVKASNSRGPVAGVSIALSTESSGGGSISPRSATTGADGTAQFTWTLGPRLGTQTLTATFSGTSTVTATLTAVAMAGPPTQVITTSPTSQNVVVGHAVSTLPSVLITDGVGNPIAGATVTFVVVQGASVLSGTSQVSNAEGRATLGGWTIGNDAQVYSISATIPSGGVASFTARGIPAAMVTAGGNGQSRNAGTAVLTLPSVRATRDEGSPLPNVPVEFLVTSGGGSVTGGVVSTGADGTARPTRWVLGLNPGPNTLRATTPGRDPVVFEATGVLATPAQLIASPTALTGFFGNYLLNNPEVTVLDDQGDPVAGATVNFQVTGGGGRVTSPPRTDFMGRASLTSWRLGASGAQTVSATVGSLAPANITAQGSEAPASTFQLELRLVTGTTLTPTQQAVFDAAAARWRQLILSGAPAYQVVATDIDPSGTCPSMLNEVVSGVVIYVRVVNFGAPNILGRTGLCVIRDEGFLPVQGLLEINSQALPSLESNGTLSPVILHEMAHAIGFGTIWNVSIPELGSIQLISGGGNCAFPAADPTFNGPAARAAFYGSVAAGSTFTGTAVPIETSNGCGTAYSHWRKTTFGGELLTGFLSSDQPTPLSAMTVQSLRDLGYVVNDATADAYTFQAFLQGVALSQFQLIELPLPGDIRVINRQGRTVARVPRPFK